MNIPIFQVDAFANQPFTGNPAAVCLLDQWLDDALLQNIAMENNLSETAFLVPKGALWELRWFTPTVEVDLCGHATLASAHVLFTHFKVKSDRVVFSTKVHGHLSVTRLEEGYAMDFPADKIKKLDTPEGFAEALGAEPMEVWEGRDDWMVVVDSQATIEGLAPDFRQLAKVSKRGVLVTAPGREVDFVDNRNNLQIGFNRQVKIG